MNLEKKKELLIEITNKCPLECIFCSSNSNLKKKKFIDIKDLKKLVLDAKKVDIETIQLSGGEPFQHPDIIKLVKFILNCKLNLVIYTCGNIKNNGCNQPIPLKFLKNFQNNKNLVLRFNFQTIDKKIYEYLTKNEYALDNLIKSIKNCAMYNIKTEVHVIPNNLNINTIEETIDFLLTELNVKHIKLLRLIFHGRASDNIENLVFDEDYLYHSILGLRDKYHNSDVEIGTAFSILSNSCTECKAAISKFMVSVDLELFPCTAFKNLTNCSIIIDDNNSLKNIISHKLLNIKLQKFLERLECNYCKNKNSCLEICPIQKLVCKKIIKIDITKYLTQPQVVH